MSDIIHLLPDAVANQIAAGEVIQRPASVVKELVENSIDAGATHVSVIIKGAGRTSIQVIDNGKGMSGSDARMAFERHATSKIREAKDLFALHTMGFRGEALASIAAVAQVEVRTRRVTDDVGTEIEIAASKVERQEPVQCAAGTSFTVKNLFFNVPARRKFLKSDETEMRNIIQEMQRVMLAHPDVAFTLYNGDDTVYDAVQGTLKQRIVSVIGKKSRNVAQHLLQVEADTVLVKINGFVGVPEAATKSAPQFFFANGRYMCHPYFRRAVLQAYDRMLPADVTPMFFLSLEVDPATIDVNIHPTKTEIKFENEKEIWSILSVAVKEALGKFNVAPSIDFNAEGKIEIPVAHSTAGYVPPQPRVEYNPAYNPFREADAARTQVRHWREMFAGMEKESLRGEEHCGSAAEEDMPFSITDMSGVEGCQGRLFGEETEEAHGDMFVYKGRFLCAAMKSGLAFIDIQRAMQRVMYDDMMAQFGAHSGVAQKLLFPEVLELSADDFCLFTEIEPDLKAIGFELSPFGKRMYSIDAVPAQLAESTDIIKVLEDMLLCVKERGGDVKAELRELMAESLSRSASSTRMKSDLTPDERTALVGRLFASTNPNLTPDGKVIVSVLTDKEIERRF